MAKSSEENPRLQVPADIQAPWVDSGHSGSLTPRMQLDFDGAEESQHGNHPDSEQIPIPIADKDIELTPSSIKQISAKYSLDTLHFSVEAILFPICQGARLSNFGLKPTSVWLENAIRNISNMLQYSMEHQLSFNCYKLIQLEMLMESAESALLLMFYSGSTYDAGKNGLCQALADGWCWYNVAGARKYSCRYGAGRLDDGDCSSSVYMLTHLLIAAVLF
ncbi:hypothetical protein Nepgr_002702 [Nepenthes gracilis]|uniref:Uncharacterized protein n=1 Tax=Nepenthes gracilis TaxID=150966 RepID=A0AAD3P948_NEPGR|nr:hypothetical protein Nepgr_002702 [Nepenthes gracilis]